MNRLAAALDQLEAAQERRAHADLVRADLKAELSVMQDDRTRLAVELDSALALVKSHELANDEVSRKLQKASAAIMAILARAEEA